MRPVSTRETGGSDMTTEPKPSRCTTMEAGEQSFTELVAAALDGDAALLRYGAAPFDAAWPATAAHLNRLAGALSHARITLSEGEIIVVGLAETDAARRAVAARSPASAASSATTCTVSGLACSSKKGPARQPKAAQRSAGRKQRLPLA